MKLSFIGFHMGIKAAEGNKSSKKWENQICGTCQIFRQRHISFIVLSSSPEFHINIIFPSEVLTFFVDSRFY